MTTNDTATFTVIVDSFLASGCTDYSFVDYDLYSGDTIFIDTPIKCGFSLLGSSSGSKGTAGHRMGYNTPAGDQQIVSGNLDENYTVYPNPTAGLVNIIQSITDTGDAHVNVVNQLGQVCYSGQVEFIGGTTQLELSALTNGTYIIQITSKNAPPKICKLVVVR